MRCEALHNVPAGSWDTVGVEEWADSGAVPELAVAGVRSQGR